MGQSSVILAMKTSAFTGKRADLDCSFGEQYKLIIFHNSGQISSMSIMAYELILYYMDHITPYSITTSL